MASADCKTEIVRDLPFTGSGKTIVFTDKHFMLMVPLASLLHKGPSHQS